MRVDAGGKDHHRARVNFCPNSPTYRRMIVQMATKLAERFGQHPALMIWHVSNEYGGACYCETCAAAFRTWLQQKYSQPGRGQSALVDAFWGHTFTDWSQIEPPYDNNERPGGWADDRLPAFPERTQCWRAICWSATRSGPVTPNIPITTNLMGTYPHLDYRAWAKEMDVIAWDCYPWPSAYPGDIAFLHDLNRSLKDGQPFMLMEQTPSSQNWQPVNALKRPGVLRLWSYLAVAHGADTVMYFQWRRGRSGCEKFMAR